MAEISFTYNLGESDEETVYLRRAAVMPYPVQQEIPATITRTEDGKLKVYKHPLAGPKKQTFIITAWLEEEGEEEGYCWSDLESFYHDIIEGPLKAFTYSDNWGNTHLVRIIEWGGPEYHLPNPLVKIRMVLEEDYESE